MKKFLYLAVPVVLFFFLVSTSEASPGGVALAQFSGESELGQQLENSDRDILAETILLPEDSFDTVEAAEMIRRIAKLPQPLLNRIDEEGIRVRLFEGNLTDNPTASHLKGKTPRGYTNGATWDSVPGIGGAEIVLVKIGASEKGKGHGSINLELHELAHSIDHLVYKDFSDQDSFQAIWKKERTELFPGRDYFIIYPEEYFAEAFAYYYFSAESNAFLKSTAPLTYELIKGLD
ncbi:toxin [Bacillus sp. FJAT-27225]|uniref:anthrax toxin lethal factor-related metalloendopeptidase n=1 Tax=Bacillus sp. FJAT-27225 TaxID=1743144 RepID=UPI00080C33A8|nr:toxin [Bacillus sp. FJAT-27225]OCA90848.1 toxin [Bacillus sp. FJAT-27225]